MRVVKDFKDYELIDCSGGQKLERWKDIILIRPDPQAIWQSEKCHPLWRDAHARYFRSNAGGGHWETYKKVPDKWEIHYRDLTFLVKPMGFKHVGLFPEQAVNWDLVRERIRSAGRKVRVLNLFAYTGAATAVCLSAGASVVHVDASKGMTQWAKDNAEASGVRGGEVRFIVDDCVKFVEREIRRGNRYDILIMDPPSYGRGPGGEVWKLEEKIYDFLRLCAGVLSESPLMVLINSYTAGLSPAVMEYMMSLIFRPRFGGRVHGSEIGLPVTTSGLVLPCGATSIWEKND